MKKSTLLTFAVSFFISGLVTQQAQAISVGPRIKRILATGFAGYAVAGPVFHAGIKYFKQFDVDNLTNGEVATMIAAILSLFPTFVLGMSTDTQLREEKRLWIPTIATSACCAYASYKLFKSAEQQEKKAAQEEVHNKIIQNN